MNHRSEPATEITPDHWIEPPVFAKSGTNIPAEVIAANKRAAAEINAHKDTFVKLCLEELFTEEQVGMAELLTPGDHAAISTNLVAQLDPEKLNLTIRNVYGPTIVLPTHHDPHKPKQEGSTRQTGHTLTMNYAGRWIGTMDIEYKHDGTIAIKMSTNVQAMASPPLTTPKQ
jgi:hypothetical protein